MMWCLGLFFVIFYFAQPEMFHFDLLGFVQEDNMLDQPLRDHQILFDAKDLVLNETGIYNKFIWNAVLLLLGVGIFAIFFNRKHSKKQDDDDAPEP